jgi:hypothetical protein
MNSFEQDLSKLINNHNLEQYSDTPDFVLARYLVNCLTAFNAALQKREPWYGRKITPKDDIPVR